MTRSHRDTHSPSTAESWIWTIHVPHTCHAWTRDTSYVCHINAVAHTHRTMRRSQCINGLYLEEGFLLGREGFDGMGRGWGPAGAYKNTQG